MMAARKLRRIHAALAAHNGDIAPIASISATGGTVLLPDVPGADVDELVERLADAGQIAVTATTGSAAIDDISVTAPHLYEPPESGPQAALHAGHVPHLGSGVRVPGEQARTRPKAPRDLDRSAP